jgi:acetylornithine deacetylase/succinyl-diaminopimelate desuccinylase-like protein
LRRDMKALAADPTNAAAAARISERPELNALLRTTCVATVVRAGEAENALPQRAQATIQCRLLPGDSPETVEQTLRGVVADPTLELALARPVNPSPETEPDPAVIGAVRQVVKGLWGELPFVLRMDTGGSDAVFTRGAGIPTYGVGAVFSDVADNRHHGRDERITKADFESGVEFAYRLMKRLSSSQRR